METDVNDTAPPASPTSPDGHVCRVCHGPASNTEPLLYPCRCKGSIQYCHESCLSDWLAVSHGTKCELCRHEYQWQKVYGADTPAAPPKLLLLRHLLSTCVWTIAMAGRCMLVASLWLGVVPYVTLGAWRGVFYLCQGWTQWTQLTADTTGLSYLPVFMSPSDLYGLLSFNASSAMEAAEIARSLASCARSAAPSNFSAAPSLSTLESAAVHIMSAFAPMHDVPSSGPQRSALFRFIAATKLVLGDLLQRGVGPLHVDAQTGDITGVLPRGTLARYMAFEAYEKLDNLLRDQQASDAAILKRTVESIARDCFTGQIIVCCTILFGIAVFLLREWVISHEMQQEFRQPLPPLAVPQAPPEPAAPRPRRRADTAPTARAALIGMAPEVEGGAPEPSSPAYSGDALSPMDIVHSGDADTWPDTDQRAPTTEPLPQAVAVANAGLPPAPLPPVIAAPALRAPMEQPPFEDEFLIEADIEGIMEAIGIRGSLLQMLLNAALLEAILDIFVTFAVWIPLMLGRTFVGLHVWRLAILPISLVRVFTDPLADALLRITHLAKLARRPSAVSLALKARLLQAVRAVAVQVGVKSPAPAPAKSGLSIATMIMKVVGDKRLRHWEALLRARWYGVQYGDTIIDRCLTIAIGYSVVAMFCAVYIRLTRSKAMSTTMKDFHDSLIQQFRLVKAAAFFCIEILLFPTLCGILLSITSIPLLPNVTLASRLAYSIKHPLTTVFLFWLAGSNFMYMFASLINVVRKRLRPGTLWFIRDPTDVDTNPLREILASPILTQLRKITRSFLVYGAIILSCFGGLPWLCRACDNGLLPLRWNMTQPISSNGLDMLVLLTVLPHTISRGQAAGILKVALAHWFSTAARQLRLSSFLLGRRHADEEGSYIRKTWRAWLTLQRAPVVGSQSANAQRKSSGFRRITACWAGNGNPEDVAFRPDGGFARVAAVDNVKLVPNAMFIRVTKDGTGVDAAARAALQAHIASGTNTTDKFTQVYIPPHFAARVALFVYLFWLTACLTIFGLLAVPIVLGRFLLDHILPTPPAHDVYSHIVGLYVILQAIQLYCKWKAASLRPTGGNSAQTTLPTNRTWRQYHIHNMTGGTLWISQMISTAIVGLLLQAYVFAPFQGSNALSLRSAFAYGVFTRYIAKQIRHWNDPHDQPAENANRPLAAPAERVNALVGQANNAHRLNGPLAVSVKANTLGILLLLLPGLLASAYTHMQVAVGIRSKADVATVASAYVWTRLLVAYVAAVRILHRPIRRMLLRWRRSVWEAEYIVKGRLLNVDEHNIKTEPSGPPIDIS